MRKRVFSGIVPKPHFVTYARPSPKIGHQVLNPNSSDVRVQPISKIEITTNLVTRNFSGRFTRQSRLSHFLRQPDDPDGGRPAAPRLQGPALELSAHPVRRSCATVCLTSFTKRYIIAGWGADGVRHAGRGRPCLLLEP